MKSNSRNSVIMGILLFLFIAIVFPCRSQQKNNTSLWPKITKETRPWSRWWWMGSAVDETNLTNLMVQYGKAGFGGLEITPIYGAVGYEQKYLSFLSPEWMKMLDVSVREARRNGMGIDMNTGTGWPFGGPHITTDKAASRLILQKYTLSKGEKLAEKLIQTDQKQKDAGAILQAVTAYDDKGSRKDLTPLVDQSGNLQWVAESGVWEIYAAFSGKTLQKVKRAAPGGEGLTFDHFSKEATTHYLARFDSAFKKSNHGTAYSPTEAGWPGWLFYASVNFAPSNSFWPHLIGLNSYITRCQSILQSGVAHNDLLVYWPVYDVWMQLESNDLMLTIHSIDKWLYPTPFCKDVKELMQKGYSLDYVSDRLLNSLAVKNGLITTKSGSTYRALVIPASKYMPVETFRRIRELASEGAEVIFQQLPEDVPGMAKLEERRQQRLDLVNSLSLKATNTNGKVSKIGKGEVFQSDALVASLESKRINREELTDLGLKYIRRKSDAGVYYYLVNHTAKKIDGFVPLNVQGSNCLLLDPQSGVTGLAQQEIVQEQLKVRLQLNPGESMFVLVSRAAVNAGKWNYLEKSNGKITLGGPWKLGILPTGMPAPESAQISRLVSWTELSDSNAHNYSGSALYTASFELSKKVAGEYLLDLGKVCESARVRVNGQDAGILWSIPYSARIGKFLKVGTNKIEIEVANLMANRIRQMDQQKVVWRNYHEINFVNIDYKPFDASGWKPMESGLLGPVTITPYQIN